MNIIPKRNNMKNKLLALLQTKFNGVENAILDRIAAKKVEGVTDENQLPAIAEGIGFQDVLNSYGDYRAGGATQSAIRNYEKEHNLKDGKPIEQPGGGQGAKSADDEPEWFKAYKQQQEERREEERAASAREQAKIERYNLITKKAKELGIPEWRINEGFSIADDADEKAIGDQLAKIQQNIVAAGLEGKSSGFPLSTNAEKGKELAKEWAETLPDKD